MSLFGGTDVKFKRLIEAIDERLRLYERIISEGSEPHPPGLLTLQQEFRNLKIKAWDIETGHKDAQLIHDLHEEEAKKQIAERGDLI